MKRALRIGPFRLSRNDKYSNTRKLLRQIFDPTNGIAIFEKWFDEQNIGVMLSNKVIRLRESMCGTANIVTRVASYNCDQALLTDYSVADRHDPPWFIPRTRFRRCFHNKVSLCK